MAVGYRQAIQVAVLGTLLAGGSFSAGNATGRQVDLELVLAIDVSSSIDRQEYILQTKGLAEAFRSAEVADAIRQFAPRGIAVTVLQWASETDHNQAVGWRWIGQRSDGAAFADRVGAMPRIGHEGVTAIGAAIHRAHGLFQGNGFQGARRVIDVSGDGILNQGPPIEPARQRAIADGITINGLAITNEEPNLTAYYRKNVIGGSRAFAMTAVDYIDFARAIRAKLVREISNAQLTDNDLGDIENIQFAESRNANPIEFGTCITGLVKLSSLSTKDLSGGASAKVACANARSGVRR